MGDDMVLTRIEASMGVARRWSVKAMCAVRFVLVVAGVFVVRVTLMMFVRTMGHAMSVDIHPILCGALVSLATLVVMMGQLLVQRDVEAWADLYAEDPHQHCPCREPSTAERSMDPTR